MKKTALLSLIIVGFFAVCFGTYTSSSSTYKTPILKTALNFQANYDNGKVHTSWASIDGITSNWMKRYKVVKSKTNRFPVYPEDGYITAISNRSQTNFTETNPSNGTYYYRVCAIMQDMNRYCSNVVELTINQTTTTTNGTTTTTSTIATPLTSSLKTMIEWLATQFMEKLNTRYPDSISTKITILDTLTSQLGTLAVGKYAALFSYLQEKLEEHANILRLQSLLDI